MTSLAKQLDRLKVASVVQTKLGSDKQRWSLLFDPKDAATLDKDAVYEIGRRGFERLQCIDSQFSDHETFSDVLFSTSSMDFNRNNETQQINRDLDKTIQAFLVILAPHLQQKAALMCLEWLVYRFYINERENNVDDLLMCALLHHDSVEFVKILQIISLDGSVNKKWQWLLPCAKSGTPLSRATLINHAQSDVSFLNLICERVAMFVKVLGVENIRTRPAVGLYAVIVLGVLRDVDQSPASEALVSTVVQSLCSVSLKSSCVDLRAASYMILSQLCNTTTLNETTIQSLMTAFSQNMTRNLFSEAVACLAVITNRQPVKDLPDKCCRQIWADPGAVQVLTQLSKMYCIEKLLVKLLGWLVQQAVQANYADILLLPQHNALTVLVQSLESIDIGQTLADIIVRNIIRHLADWHRQVEPSSAGHWSTVCKQLLSLIERRWPDCLIEQASKLQCDKRYSDVVHDVLLMTSTPVNYQIVPELSTSLMLGLNHANSATRLASVRHLLKKIEQHDQDLTADFVSDQLLCRLRDSCPKVVRKVISHRQILTSCVDKKHLADCLTKLMLTWEGQSEWHDAQVWAVKILSADEMLSEVPDLSVWLLPFLLVTTHSDMDLVRTILKSSVVRCEPLSVLLPCELMEQVNKIDTSGVSGLSAMNWLLMKGLAHGLQNLSEASYFMMVSVLVNSDQHRRRNGLVLMTVVLSVALPACVSNSRLFMAIACDIVKLVELIFSAPCKKDKLFSEEVKSMELSDVLVSWIKYINKHGIVPHSLALWSINKLVESIIALPSSVLDSDNGNFLHVFAGLLVLQRDRLGMDICCNLVERLCQELNKTLLFRTITTLLVRHKHIDSEKTDVTSDIVLSCFDVVCQVCSNSETKPILDALQHSNVLPHLLMFVTDDCAVVRHGSIAAVESVLRVCKSLPNLSSCLLLKKILKKREEIAADNSYAPQIFGHTLLKKKQSTSIADIADWLLAETIPICVKYGLVKLLKFALPSMVLEPLVQLGDSLLKPESSMLSAESMDLMNLILERFDPDGAALLAPTTSCMAFLQKSLESYQIVAADGRSVQTLALSQVSRNFFRALPSVESQQMLLSVLINICVDSKQTSARSMLMSCLKQLKLNVEHISHELVTAESPETSLKKGVKKTKLDVARPALEIGRLIVVLEAVQSRKKFSDANALTGLLFTVLRRLMSEEGEDVDYCKQLTLTCLYNVCSYQRDGSIQKREPMTSDATNIEVLVQCIRNALSRQTQQQALFVMTAVASLYPEHILHNAMSIFTFVGGNLAQHDDIYSFGLITRTINTVIPALFDSQDKSTASLTSLCQLSVNIVRVFVDARSHIPRHRSLLLFHELIDKLGVDRTLGMVGLCVVESSIRSKDALLELPDEGGESKARSVDHDIAFVVSVFNQFSASNQLKSITSLIYYLHQLLSIVYKDKSVARQPCDPQLLPLNVTGHLLTMASVEMVVSEKTLTSQQLRLVAHSASKLIASLLANEQLISQVVTEVSGDAKIHSEVFEQLLTRTVSYVTALSRYNVVQYSNVAIQKFWKSLEHRALDILEKVNYLLPLSQFIVQLSSLCKHQITRVREKAHALFNLRLRQLNADKLCMEEIELLRGQVVDQLVNIANVEIDSLSSPSMDVSSAGASPGICQLALIGLQLLCRLLGENYPDLFISVNSVATRILDSDGCLQNCPAVMANALLYVAELCSVLKVRAISCMPSFMPGVLKICSNWPLLYGHIFRFVSGPFPFANQLVKDPCGHSLQHETILVSLLILLQKALSNIPQFLSQYIVQIMLCVCILDQQSQFDSKSQVTTRLDAVRHLISTAISPRIILSGSKRLTDSRLSAVYHELIATNQLGVISLLEIIKKHVSAMSREDLESVQDALWTLFCQHLLNVRNDCNNLSWVELERVEEGVVSAVQSTVLRLPEINFRTVKFAKLYSSACGDDDSVYFNRRLTFFRICDQLVTKLQSLFVPLAGQFLNAACKILDECNSFISGAFSEDDPAIQKTCCLLNSVLSCLHKCLLYNREDPENAHDTGGLFGIDRMKQLMQPLVNQLGNQIGGSEESERRLVSLVIPCITQLSVECHKDSDTLRHLNRLICQKTKPSDCPPRTRFAALLVMEEMARKLGDMYEKVLLPEAIVTLSELVEDETEEVEQQCQKVMKTLQELFGEDLL